MVLRSNVNTCKIAKLPAETVAGIANPRFTVPLLSKPRQHDGCPFVRRSLSNIYYFYIYSCFLVNQQHYHQQQQQQHITITKSEKKPLITVSHICTNVLLTYVD